VIKTLHPGQPGTQAWQRLHGGALVCVRYRVDAADRRRYTTVELVVAEAPLHHRAHPATLVYVALDGPAYALRQRAKARGAQWDPSSRMWRMSLGTAQALGLQHAVYTKRKRKDAGGADEAQVIRRTQGKDTEA
jgi:hypothetical protein